MGWHRQCQEVLGKEPSGVETRSAPDGKIRQAQQMRTESVVRGCGPMMMIEAGSPPRTISNWWSVSRDRVIFLGVFFFMGSPFKAAGSVFAPTPFIVPRGRAVNG